MGFGESSLEDMVESFWKNKKVFLTGHTGFKGSWASLWLLKAGAQLTGYSKDIPTNPSLFEELKISEDMNSIIGDVRDLDFLKKSVALAKPEIIIHMAAQPLVRYSYTNPVETYMTNVMGTVHLFEAALGVDSVKAVLNVTTDKCYENQEREEGYKEHEPMGGHDPYSNSKGCSELVTSAYRNSFFAKRGIGLASARAGNVIGGGDWALDRLVPDIIRAVYSNEKLFIRNPMSTRPWQHVLEPVSGYFRLSQLLYSEPNVYSEGFNFGPNLSDNCSVEHIIKIMNKYWDGRIKYEIVKSDHNPHEAKLLSLDCTKAEKIIGWRPRWNIDKALESIIEWNNYRQSQNKVKDICLKQISDYEFSK